MVSVIRKKQCPQWDSNPRPGLFSMESFAITNTKRPNDWPDYTIGAIKDDKLDVFKNLTEL